MLILLTRLASLALALVVGLISAVVVSFPILFICQLGWIYWNWPYEDVFGAYPLELWVLLLYGAGVLILLSIPALRELFLDMAFGHRRLSDREKVSAAQIEEELAWRCRARNIKKPKLVWRVWVSPDVNGSAYGRNRVTLTQRLMIAARNGSDKWKGGVVGIAAHELGHIYYGDGLFYLWFNMLCWPVLFVIKTTYVLSHIQVSVMVLRRVIVPIGFVFLLFNYAAHLLHDIALLPHALTSRLREYRADRFAYRLGLGREMIFVMEHWLRRETVHNKGLKKLIDTHPPTEFRIQAIEQLIEKNKDKPVSHEDIGKGGFFGTKTNTVS